MGDLSEDLTDVLHADKPGTDTLFAAGRALVLVRTHHATIQQNAEDAKRLMALGQAMEEALIDAFHTSKWIKERADEILREGEPHDQD